MFSDIQIKFLKEKIHSLKINLGGKLLFYVFSYRRKIVLNNINLVFGEILSTEEIRKLAFAYHSHLVYSIIEIIKSWFMSKRKLLDQVVVIGYEHLLKLRDKPSGALLITGHLGNWELAPLIAMRNFLEFRDRFYFVRKFIRIKIIEKLAFHRYIKADLKVISSKNGMSQILSALENNNAVIFVIDQYAIGKQSIAVEFFGKKTATYKSPAYIAKYANVPVCPARSYRRADGRHVVEYFPALQWLEADNWEQELYLNTKRYNEILEGFILEHPEQWLWGHLRWR